MMNRVRLAITGVAAATVMSAQAPAPAPPAAPQANVWVGQNLPGGSYLGVGVADVDSDRAKALSLREVRGVEITKVEDESPASKGGLKIGDVVLEYNGQRVEGTEQLLRMVRETPPGREVKFGISRNGKTESVSLTTGKRKSATFFTREGQPMRVEMPIPRMEVMIPDVPQTKMSWRSGMLGIEAESLTGPLAEYFGVKEGVLVRNVGKDTAAEKAGLKAGDVITKVDARDVVNAREVTTAIRTLREKDKKTFSVTFMRDRKELTLPVTLDDSDGPRPPRTQTVQQQ